MSLFRPLLLASLMVLSGCTGLLRSTAPALQLYVLEAPQVSAAGSAPQAAAPTLIVARPLPGPGLNTDRIALLRPGGRLDYYAGSRWSAPLADLVSDLQLVALRADSSWSAVADDRSSFNAAYLLQTSIDRFTAEYPAETGSPRVQVDLHCFLIRRADGVLLGSFAVSESEQAQANRMASVVTAFSQAADRAVTAVAGQAAALLKSARPPATP